MVTNKHTPGTWVEILNPLSKTKEHLIQAGENQLLICRVTGEEVDDSEIEPNAKLIASAPKLLEILQHIEKWADKADMTIYKGSALHLAIKEAINQATQ